MTANTFWAACRCNAHSTDSIRRDIPYGSELHGGQRLHQRLCVGLRVQLDGDRELELPEEGVIVIKVQVPLQMWGQMWGQFRRR